MGKEISVENQSYLKRKGVINKPKILFEEYLCERYRPIICVFRINDVIREITRV